MIADFPAVHFVVGRATMSSTGNDVVDIWFDIALTETEGTIGSADSSAMIANATVGNFFMANAGNGHLAVYDEIRLGDTLADVTPVPEPGALCRPGVAQQRLECPQMP